MSEALAPFFGSAPVVHNDALLLGGALLRHNVPWGIALIAGTGSVAVALEAKDGLVAQAARRGGHGYLLGDDGSAWDVGRWACRVVVDAFDAGEDEGELAAVVRRHFGVESTPEVLGKVHELGDGSPIEAANAAKLRVTSLARPVLELLAKEDPLAEKAVRAAAGPLAMSAVQLVHQMYRLRGEELVHGKAKAPMLVCGGGCLRQPHYRAIVSEMCWREGVTFKEIVVVEDVAGEAVMGLVEKA
jgi:N-acetylglucosamine kinase-like BadF-type ATPase